MTDDIKTVPDGTFYYSDDAEKLKRLLYQRDCFIVDKGLWLEFVGGLPASPPDLLSIREENARLREALRRLVTTYTGFEDGDGNPCPDVEFGRQALNGGRDGK